MLIPSLVDAHVAALCPGLHVTSRGHISLNPTIRWCQCLVASYHFTSFFLRGGCFFNKLPPLLRGAPTIFWSNKMEELHSLVSSLYIKKIGWWLGREQNRYLEFMDSGLGCRLDWFAYVSGTHFAGFLYLMLANSGKKEMLYTRYVAWGSFDFWWHHLVLNIPKSNEFRPAHIHFEPCETWHMCRIFSVPFFLRTNFLSSNLTTGTFLRRENIYRPYVVKKRSEWSSKQERGG
jgi:hypothetical protein